ncbi:MAG: NADP-dependent malic enzyme [Candidatus Gracilibacteria bacterium]|jgi:malate dehydrogenase (oxaloacetate-decarboxylating)|nr:NADP-dependent malic enzyme [Candidatus Gracilibacteria bacterium]
MDPIKSHKDLKGKIEISSKSSLSNSEALSVFYTPGVAQVSSEIAKDRDKSFEYTWRKNTIAIVSDGTAVLGLGDIGPEGALPVMEGKSAIFKEFGGINAIPLCINTKDTDEIVKFCQQIAPTFGGINLEDISAPRCFEIERILKETLDVPVFHDDQHGTAIVTMAGLLNALKIVDKDITTAKIVISGAGAAGISIARLLVKAGAINIVTCDSKGAIYAERESLNSDKMQVAKYNLNNEKGHIHDIIKNADIFIGVSKGGILSSSDIENMADDAIVFAMANPTPEILPDEAKKSGARVIATGRSDFPNQVNNALVFPGIFKGILNSKYTQFTDDMFLTSAKALADMVENPSEQNILPKVFDKKVADIIGGAILSL